MPLVAAAEGVYAARPSYADIASRGSSTVSAPPSTSERPLRSKTGPLPFHIPRGSASCCYTLTKRASAQAGETAATTTEDWEISVGGEANNGKARSHLTLSRVSSSAGPSGVQVLSLPQLPAIKYGSLIAVPGLSTPEEAPAAEAAGKGAKGGAAKAAPAAAAKGAKGAAPVVEAAPVAAPTGPTPPSLSSSTFLFYGGFREDGSLSEDLFLITVDPLGLATYFNSSSKGTAAAGVVTVTGELAALVKEKKEVEAANQQQQAALAAAAAAAAPAPAPAPAGKGAKAAPAAAAAAAPATAATDASASQEHQPSGPGWVLCTRLTPPPPPAITPAPASASAAGASASSTINAATSANISLVPSLACLKEGPSPGPRAFASLALNPAGNRLALFGGVVPATTSGGKAGANTSTSPKQLANDLWILDLAHWSWTRVSGYGQAGPSPRAAAGLLFVSALPPPPTTTTTPVAASAAGAPAAGAVAVPPAAAASTSAATNKNDNNNSNPPALIDIRSHVTIPAVLEGPFEASLDGSAAAASNGSALPDGVTPGSAAAVSAAMTAAVESIIVFGGLCCSTLPSSSSSPSPSSSTKTSGGSAAADPSFTSRGQSFDSTGLPAPASSVSGSASVAPQYTAAISTSNTPAISPWDGRVYAVSFDSSLVNAAASGGIPKTGDTSPFSAMELAAAASAAAGASAAAAAAAPAKGAKAGAKGGAVPDASAAGAGGGPSISGCWGFFGLLQKKMLDLEPGHFEFAKVPAPPVSTAAGTGAAPGSSSSSSSSSSASVADGAASPTPTPTQTTATATATATGSATGGAASALAEASELPALRRLFFSSLGGSVNPSSVFGGSGAFSLLSTDNDGCTSILLGASHGDPAGAPFSSPHSHSSVPLPHELTAAFNHSASALVSSSSPAGATTPAAAPPLTVAVAVLHATSLDFVPSAVLQSRAQQEAGSRKADLTQGESDGLGGRILAKRGPSKNVVKRIYKGVGGYSGEVDAKSNARDGQGVMKFAASTPASLPIPASGPAFPIVSLAGCEYEGGWANDAFSGKGVLRMPGGACYEGNFEAGLPHCEHGAATMVWPEGYVPAPPAAASTSSTGTGASISLPGRKPHRSTSRASASSFSETEGDENHHHNSSNSSKVSHGPHSHDDGDDGSDGGSSFLSALLSSLDPNDTDAVLAAQASPLVDFSKPTTPTAAKTTAGGAAAGSSAAAASTTARKNAGGAGGSVSARGKPSSSSVSASSPRQPLQPMSAGEDEATLPDGSLKPPPLPKPLSIASWRWARYDGPWFQGRPHTSAGATATVLFSNGATYTGEVQDGRIHGRGKLQASIANTKTQLTMDGTWVDNGLLHGPLCTITVAITVVATGSATVQNESFSGGFERGIRSGQGTHYARDGSYFSGEFFNGRRNGWGVARSGPYVYEGRFVADVRCGKGSQCYPDGSCYVGSFFDNKPSGEGVKRYPDGREERGVWRRGRLLPSTSASPPRAPSPPPIKARAAAAVAVVGGAKA